MLAQRLAEYYESTIPYTDILPLIWGMRRREMAEYPVVGGTDKGCFESAQDFLGEVGNNCRFFSNSCQVQEVNLAS